MFRIVAEEIVKADGTLHETFALDLQTLIDTPVSEWEANGVTVYISPEPAQPMNMHHARQAIHMHVMCLNILRKAEHDAS